MKNLYLLFLSFMLSVSVLNLSAVEDDDLPAVSSEPSASTGFFSKLNWSILASGSWEENKTLHNRLDLKLIYSIPGTFGDLTLRGQVLDRRPLNFELDSPWGDTDKWVTHYQGALYHNKTGSRLLIGALDEWGLSARIRNPWIRSPPYAENHKPLIADLKTAASSTKNDEVYLYLSAPFIKLFPNINMRPFFSAQTEIGDINTDYRQSAASFGIDFSLPGNSNLLIESFITETLLPPKERSTWFSNPPPLPERHYTLYAAGLLFSNSTFSVSSDFAFSETFFWGADIYANFGFSVSLPVPGFIRKINKARIQKPLKISFAADGGGERLIYRDAAGHGSGFRNAVKAELKGARNSLFRISTTLRGPDPLFNRSSSNIYFRMPYAGKNSSFLRLSRISISIDRNAENPLKITDRLYGYIGFSINLYKFGIKTPFGMLFNGSIRGITSGEGKISPFPGLIETRKFEDYDFYGEFSFSPSVFQFKSRVGFSKTVKKEQIWDFSLTGAVRFKKGRISIKAASPQFPDKWNFTISWRKELNSSKKQ